MDAGERIDELKASAYTIPTDLPESDGTMAWNSTTIVLVTVSGAGKTGMGYTYADSSVAHFIERKLKPAVLGKSSLDIAKIFDTMSLTIRNEGHCGMAYMAVSAVDAALWDLKARILAVPLCDLIGKTCEEVLIYGSGGFTSYTQRQLEKQLGGWAADGIRAVKMKIGRDLEKDSARVNSARKAIGDQVQLFIDANGAYNVKQALYFAEEFNEHDISWFEEPVSSDDVSGLKFIREHAPFSIQIAAGEYGYASGYFFNMLQTGAVDVLQADATRCGGITGFLKAGYLAEAFHIPFSFHCAPSLHLHAALCLPGFYTGEYFHDHVRIENMLFDGVSKPVSGYLKPDLTQPGLGLTFKYQDAKRYELS